VTVRRARVLAGLVLVVLAAGCGRKGPPLPPLRLEPAPITDVELRRIEERVEIAFTVPAANADGSTPSVLDRIEVYAASAAPGAPAPSVVQILDDPKNLKGTVRIRDESATAEGGSPDRGVAPGERTVFIDRNGTDLRGPDAPVLHYLVVGVVGRSRKARPSGPFEVPLSVEPPAPQGLVIAYDEQELNLTWQQGAEGDRFRVYDVPAGRTVADSAAAGPLLDSPKYAQPIVFDVERCFTVRRVQVKGPVTIDGPAAPIRCETPIDRFPPAAPGGLLAVPGGDGTVELTWDPVSAKDVAGYVVLRSGGGGDTLLPLTKRMPDLHHTDRDVTRGTTYSYAVVAEDARGNVSARSATQSVTVRMP
jgi:uncharacterized protein